jgi:hypothetical protein
MHVWWGGAEGGWLEAAAAAAAAAAASWVEVHRSPARPRLLVRLKRRMCVRCVCCEYANVCLFVCVRVCVCVLVCMGVVKNWGCTFKAQR